MSPTSRMMKHPIALIVAAAIPMASLNTYAGEGSLGAGGVPGIAEREIARRLARIQDAQKAMERGDELFSQGDHEGALAQYRAAKEIFDQLPNAPFIQDWRDLANLKFADCAVVVAREKAAKGDYVAARGLLQEAVAAVPGHRKAALFAAQLDDPDRWPPALTPEHVENVGKVQKGLLLGASSVEIGNYDKALEQYEDVLRIDPYNTAARRGMENAERKRSEYFSSAYDHQRSRMLNMVNEAWEHKPAIKGFQVESTTSGAKAPTVYLSQKMQKIVFPQVQFSGASIEEAVEFLRVKSRDLDVFETDPARKGVNIILKAGSDAPTASISLDLKDVPMQEALRYVTELAGMKFKVEPFAVLIVPVTETTTEQFTRIYKVPPDFETMGGGGGDTAAPAAPADPFAAGGAAANPSGLTKRQSALDILKAQGILFPDGATAVFNKVTSQLIVKNTQPNLDLVEAFVDSIINQVTKQVYITTKFVEVTQKNTDELGFDWLLGGLGVNADNVVVGGGSDGNFGGRVSYTGDLATMVGGGAVAPVTRGLRTGSRAIRGDSVDSLFNPIDASADTVAPGVLSIAGIFTDPQFGVVIRALAQRKGVDLMSAPSVTTKGGQQATVEVIREFIYPTEFDPPQIPTNVGAAAGVGGGGGTAGAIPVTPTTPTAFEMRPVGVRMEVDPVIGENGSIDLNLLPEVTEFDGFINYGSPIYSVQPLLDVFGFPIGSTQIELTPNIINQPIFSTRKVKTSVTVWDGQTVALGGLIREDVQDVEDKLPVLGDVPIIGRLFRSEVEDHFKRNLMIFVTAVLIDPAGQRIRQAATGGGSSEVEGPNSALLPSIGN